MTAIEALRQLVDVMRRADPYYTRSHGVEPCTDDEWNEALEQAEDAIEGAA